MPPPPAPSVYGLGGLCSCCGGARAGRAGVPLRLRHGLPHWAMRPSGRRGRRKRGPRLFCAPLPGPTQRWHMGHLWAPQWAPPRSRDDRPVREERRCGWRGPSPPRDPPAPERCSEFTASPGRVNYAVSRDFQVERFSVTLRRNSGLGFEHRPSSAAPRRFPKVVLARGHSRRAPGSRFPSLAIKKLSLLKSGPRRP